MKGNAILYGFFGALVLMVGGVIFLIVRVSSNFSEQDEFTSIDLVEEREMVGSKLQAYNAQFQDSIVAVRDENVKVNLKRLWGNKVGEEQPQEELNRLVEEVTNEPVKEEPQKPTYNRPQYKPKPAPVHKPEPEEQPTETVTKPTLDELYPEKDGFNSSFDDKPKHSNTTDVISAVVHDKQTVQSNTKVKFRLTEDVQVNGLLIPEGTFVSGKASLYNERVKVDFESIIIDGRLIPFQYTTYDPDGWVGIHVPGLVINDASKDLMRQATSEANARISLPVIGSVAFNTAQKENDKAVANLARDYPVFLMPKSN